MHKFSPFPKIETVCTVNTNRIELDRMYDNKFLRSITKSCFETYSHRLSEISKEIFNSGARELEFSKTELLDKILDFDLREFSLSVTSSPSLHYNFQVGKNISLYVETYLDDGFETFYSLYKGNELIKEGPISYSAAIRELNDLVSEESRCLMFNESLGAYGGCE